jgi:hypothetical protein
MLNKERRKPMATEQFTGTWKLISNEFRQSDSQTTYPYGRDAVGILMYDDKGHFSAQMMRLNRPLFTSGDNLQGTPAEIKAAYEGFIAYYGVYEVNQEKHTIIHHAEGCSFPNWVGTAQKRFYEFSNNRLTLSTPPILFGSQEITAALTWERVE